jgi:hypothetical protein
MKLRYIGEDKSMGLKKDKVYNVKIHAYYDRIWVHTEEKNRVINCPYNSIKLLLENWEEL